MNHKIVLPEGYVKELRQLVKKNGSKYQVYLLLSDIYKAGYLQAIKDYTVKINEEIERVNNQGLNIGDDLDGEQLQPDSSIDGEREGPAPDDADSSEGSGDYFEGDDGVLYES